MNDRLLPVEWWDKEKLLSEFKPEKSMAHFPECDFCSKPIIKYPAPAISEYEMEVAGIDKEGEVHKYELTSTPWVLCEECTNELGLVIGQKFIWYRKVASSHAKVAKKAFGKTLIDGGIRYV